MTDVEQHTLHEQRQECDEEHQEDRDNAVLDPVKDRNEVVAAVLSGKGVATRVDLADGELFVERAKIEHCKVVSILSYARPAAYSTHG